MNNVKLIIKKRKRMNGSVYKEITHDLSLKDTVIIVDNNGGFKAWPLMEKQ